MKESDMKRQQPVMGRGSHQAALMLIAEAPGAQEDRQGLPITKIVKCRPPKNRDPEGAEKRPASRI